MYLSVNVHKYEKAVLAYIKTGLAWESIKCKSGVYQTKGWKYDALWQQRPKNMKIDTFLKNELSG